MQGRRCAGSERPCFATAAAVELPLAPIAQLFPLRGNNNDAPARRFMKMSSAPVARQFASRLTRESGGIGIIVPISGNHVFPLVAHPVFVDLALSFLQSARGSSPRCFGERQPYPIRRPRIVAVLLMHFVTHPAHVVGGNVVERLRVIPRFDGLGDRMLHSRPSGVRKVFAPLA